MSAAQVKEKIQRILAEALGSVSVDKDGDFFVRQDSAVVFVRVVERGDGTTIVKSFAHLLTDVKLTPEVFRWVAIDGQEYFFGHARVIEGDNGLGLILFEHILLGDFLDAEELKWAVLAVVSAANDMDDDLQARFGGKKFIED